MRTTAAFLVVSFLLAHLAVPAHARSTREAGASQEAADWHKVAEAVPLGTKVKVQTVDGHRISGTLMRVDSAGLLVKRNTRYPEPAASVTFANIAKIERQKEGGVNVAKAIAIGIASGAGAMLTLILFAMQLD